MADTKIEWTDKTWNPTRGCSRVSEGCRNCYAERQAARFAGPGGPYEGLVRRTADGPRWTGRLVLDERALVAPLRWRKPRRVFTNSMSDLFHDALTDEQIDRVFAVMGLCPQHTFQVLTKRPERMREYILAARQEAIVSTVRVVRGAPRSLTSFILADGLLYVPDRRVLAVREWPLPHVHLGVSVEDQPTADERIPLLLETPAALRFVSAEPLLGRVDLTLLRTQESNTNALAGWRSDDCERSGVPREKTERLDWVIVGGESGPGARPCDAAWIRSLVEQCKAAGTACFVKQLGAKPVSEATDFAPWYMTDKKGGDPAEWPEDLRVRELPE